MVSILYVVAISKPTSHIRWFGAMLNMGASVSGSIIGGLGGSEIGVEPIGYKILLCKQFLPKYYL